MLYRKKPIEVEAMQFTDEMKNRVFSWASQIQGNIFPDFKDHAPIIKIPTLEGEMICEIGDYIIKEPFPTDWRRLYPCKADIFEQTYEKAGD